MDTPDFRIGDRVYTMDIVAFYQSQSVCLQDVAEDRHHRIGLQERTPLRRDRRLHLRHREDIKRSH
jgi:hypothetical protein